MPGLLCRSPAFSACGAQGLLRLRCAGAPLLAVRRLLPAEASLAAELGCQSTRASGGAPHGLSCSSARGGLPGPGLESVFPAFAGTFLQGSPCCAHPKGLHFCLARPPGQPSGRDLRVHLLRTWREMSSFTFCSLRSHLSGFHSSADRDGLCSQAHSGRNFAGGPVVKNPRFRCRGRSFHPGLKHEDPACSTVQPKKEKTPLKPLCRVCSEGCAGFSWSIFSIQCPNSLYKRLLLEAVFTPN